MWRYKKSSFEKGRCGFLMKSRFPQADSSSWLHCFILPSIFHQSDLATRAHCFVPARGKPMWTQLLGHRNLRVCHFWSSPGACSSIPGRAKDVGTAGPALPRHLLPRRLHGDALQMAKASCFGAVSRGAREGRPGRWGGLTPGQCLSWWGEKRRRDPKPGQDSERAGGGCPEGVNAGRVTG